MDFIFYIYFISLSGDDFNYYNSCACMWGESWKNAKEVEDIYNILNKQMLAQLSLLQAVTDLTDENLESVLDINKSRSVIKENMNEWRL